MQIRYAHTTAILFHRGPFSPFSFLGFAVLAGFTAFSVAGFLAFASVFLPDVLFCPPAEDLSYILIVIPPVRFV